jgi:glycerol-3-phosphate dehydrogenase
VRESAAGHRYGQIMTEALIIGGGISGAAPAMAGKTGGSDRGWLYDHHIE